MPAPSPAIPWCPAPGSPAAGRYRDPKSRPRQKSRAGGSRCFLRPMRRRLDFAQVDGVVHKLGQSRKIGGVVSDRRARHGHGCIQRRRDKTSSVRTGCPPQRSATTTHHAHGEGVGQPHFVGGVEFLRHPHPGQGKRISPLSAIHVGNVTRITFRRVRKCPRRLIPGDPNPSGSNHIGCGSSSQSQLPSPRVTVASASATRTIRWAPVCSRPAPGLPLNPSPAMPGRPLPIARRRPKPECARRLTPARSSWDS